MTGKIYRVTYNVVRQEAELHMEDGDVRTVPMMEEKWIEMIQGDVTENFNKLLNE